MHASYSVLRAPYIQLRMELCNWRYTGNLLQYTFISLRYIGRIPDCPIIVPRTLQESFSETTSYTPESGLYIRGSHMMAFAAERTFPRETEAYRYRA